MQDADDASDTFVGVAGPINSDEHALLVRQTRTLMALRWLMQRAAGESQA